MQATTATTEHAYLEELRVEFPSLQIVSKEGDKLSKLIDRFLRVVTFGSQSSYLTGYVTTLGDRIYVPSGWQYRSELSRVITMRHEAVHLRQFRRLTWLGMSLVYLLPIFPMGLAAGRAWLEWEAYRETIVATAELCGVAVVKESRLRDDIVSQFTSGAYGWMWPFPAFWRKKIASLVREIENAAT